MEPQHLSGLLTTHDIVALVRLSRTSIYRMTRQGRFPPPCSIGKGHIRWREADIRAWMEGLSPQAYGQDEPRNDPSRNRQRLS